MTCVECGTEVNDAVARCPECGADPRVGLTVDERAAAAKQADLDPVARARLARERGQLFLEVALPFDEAETRAIGFGRGGPRAASAATARARWLAAVEAEGWRLVGGGYVTTGMRYDRDLLTPVEAGPVAATSLAGIYLFRALEESPLEESSSGESVVDGATPEDFPV